MPFCPKCGVEIPSEAVFCPKCGNQVAVTPTRSIEHRYTGEKAEKREKQEKEHEKGEKHEKGGKQGDLSGPIVGGLILIWLGISFYLAQIHYFGMNEWWAYFLFGIGVILIVQAVVRYTTLTYKGPIIGSLIGGIVLMVIGLAFILGVTQWWFLILIIIGILVIFSGVTARRRTPRP